MRIAAVIPAAGSGKRLGTPVPKQYLKAGGKELIAFTLEVFQRSPLISEIAVAVHPEYRSRMARLQKKYHLTKIRHIVHGGGERADSVFAALSALSLDENDLVAVHDAARPLLTPELLSGAIRHARQYGSAVVAMKARDTLLQTGTRTRYLDRSSVYTVQTPQIFRFGELMTAYLKARKTGFHATDESMIMRHAGKTFSLFEGSLLNFKVTTPEDFKLFKRLSAL